MNYINFADKDNRIILDVFGREFLVKSGYASRSIVRNMSLQEIEKLITENSIKHRFYLYALYDDESVRFDLSEFLVDGGSLSINYNNGVRRKLSIGIFNEKMWHPSPNGFLWKGSKFKLEISVGNELVEYVYSAGIFILKDFSMSHKLKKNVIELEMVDKFGGIDGTVGGKIVDAISIPRGSNIVDAVCGLLKMNKIDGCSFDRKSPLFPSWAYGKTTPYTITESSESSIGALILKLISIINLDAFYDETGRMCFEEMQENMTVNSLPSLWTFSEDGFAYTAHSVKTDFQTVENIVIVEGGNINGKLMDAKVENINPKSPTNITIFEPKVCKIVDENISNEGSAFLRANYELFKRSLMPISQSLSTILIPFLNVNNVVTVNDIYCGIINARFLITAIDIPISNTVQASITITNLEEVAFSGR